MKKVSIIVPVYNQEKYIRRCLESILNQTYQNLEIIIIDDGSIDRTPDICNEFANKDQRILVRHIANGGVSNARNIGIQIATGDFISFVDSDDYLHPNFISTLVSAISENKNCQIAISSFYRVINGEIIPQIVGNGSNSHVVDVFKEYDYAADYTLRHIWGALYDKRLIENVRFQTDLYVGEDSLFMAEMVSQSKCLIAVKECLYYYIHYSNSASHGKIDKKKLTVVDAWTRIIDLYSHQPECSKIFLSGCYVSLFIECQNAVRILGQSKQPDNRQIYKKYMKSARSIILQLLLSNRGWKEKILYLWFCIYPSSLFRWEERKRK